MSSLEMAYTYADNEELSKEANKILQRNYDKNINVLVVGSPGSGKSSLLNRYSFSIMLFIFDTMIALCCCKKLIK